MFSKKIIQIRDTLTGANSLAADVIITCAKGYTSSSSCRALFGAKSACPPSEGKARERVPSHTRNPLTQTSTGSDHGYGAAVHCFGFPNCPYIIRFQKRDGVCNSGKIVKLNAPEFHLRRGGAMSIDHPGQVCHLRSISNHRTCDADTGRVKRYLDHSEFPVRCLPEKQTPDWGNLASSKGLWVSKFVWINSQDGLAPTYICCEYHIIFTYWVYLDCISGSCSRTQNS